MWLTLWVHCDRPKQVLVAWINLNLSRFNYLVKPRRSLLCSQYGEKVRWKRPHESGYVFQSQKLQLLLQFLPLLDRHSFPQSWFAITKKMQKNKDKPQKRVTVSILLKRERKYLSLVLPVKRTGKNLAYCPTPNRVPNSCILVESRRIKASHNRQKSCLNPSSNVLQFPWSSRTFHPTMILKVLWLVSGTSEDSNIELRTQNVPREKPFLPPGETSIFPGCGSPCMNPWTNIISANTSTNTLATYNIILEKASVFQKRNNKYIFGGSNACHMPKLYPNWIC